MNTDILLDLNNARTAWKDRISHVVNAPVTIKRIVLWDPAPDGDDLTGGRNGYTLTIPCAEVAYGDLSRHADTLARDVNRHIEIHPDADPDYLMVMVWLDMPSPTWCGARTTVEPDGMTVFCDQAPFHQEPYKISDPEDGEQIEAHGDQHHAPIPSSYSYGKQGDQFWGVGPLHVIPEDVYGIRDVLNRLERQPITDDEMAERDELVARMDPHGTGAAAADEFERRRTARHQEQIRDRLALQLRNFHHSDPEQRADELMTDVFLDMEHDTEILNARKTLWEMVDDAHGSTRVALRALSDLMSDGVYDVEYADSDTSDDIKSLLTNARRDLAAARALMPTDRKGDTKPSNHTG